MSLLDIAKRLPWIIILIGAILRGVQYLYNRSLWLDESMIALNIIDRSFFELLKPLSHSQSAPVGFVLLEKVAVQVFGNNEYALRLIPLLCGIISLFLFYEVAKRCIEPKAVLIALGLFAISDPLIYYSTEVKQYSSDLTIALLLFLAVIYIQSRRPTIPRIVLLGVLGAIVILFSHTSVFILAGVGVTLTLSFLYRKEWIKIGIFSIAYSFWAISFAIIYFCSLRYMDQGEFLKTYFSNHFMPFPPLSISDIKWIIDKFLSIFEFPVGLSLSGIALLTFIFGCISLYSKKKEMFFIFLSPILFALLASGLHKYPFDGRLLLFIVPSLLLFISEGASQIRYKTKQNIPVLGIAIISLLFIGPLFYAGHHLIKPKPMIQEEIKPVMQYVRYNKQVEDVLYIYTASVNAFKYYSRRYGFSNDDYIKGVNCNSDLSICVSDLNKLIGNKRVWILFSHVYKRNGIDQKQFFLYHLDSIGTRLDSFISKGASVYLYDLSKSQKKN
jgi:uncharacterized membrane protein